MQNARDLYGRGMSPAEHSVVLCYRSPSTTNPRVVLRISACAANDPVADFGKRQKAKPHVRSCGSTTNCKQDQRPDPLLVPVTCCRRDALFGSRSQAVIEWRLEVGCSRGHMDEGDEGLQASGRPSKTNLPQIVKKISVLIHEIAATCLSMHTTHTFAQRRKTHCSSHYTSHPSFTLSSSDSVKSYISLLL